MNMKKAWGLIGALLLVAGPAFAADPAVKARAPIYKAPVASPPQFSWTGFYVGGEVGAKGADTTWTTTSIITEALPGRADASSPKGFNPAGVRAGGYVGYN
jgi:hypothetical protein